MCYRRLGGQGFTFHVDFGPQIRARTGPTQRCADQKLSRIPAETEESLQEHDPTCSEKVEGTCAVRLRRIASSALRSNQTSATPPVTHTTRFRGYRYANGSKVTSETKHGETAFPFAGPSTPHISRHPKEPGLCPSRAKRSTLVDAGLSSLLFVPVIPEKLKRHLDESLRRFRVEKC